MKLRIAAGVAIVGTVAAIWLSVGTTQASGSDVATQAQVNALTLKVQQLENSNKWAKKELFKRTDQNAYDLNNNDYSTQLLWDKYGSLFP